MNKSITLMAAALAVASCASNEPKELVLYYSQTGTTKAVAEAIASQTGADIVAFDVTDPYTGTFDETIARCMQEQGTGYVPELAEINVDLSQYDVIYLGYPIWFGTYAPPVKALLDKVDLGGKTIVPFCTFGSGGLVESVADLKEALASAEVRDGYGVRTARVQYAPAEVERFLVNGGYVEGEAEVLPDYSEQLPVTEEEAAIFETACSSYQYPLGTPVTCGSREVAEGTEYLFIAESNGATSKVYVIAARKDGGAPEFTMVVR